MLFLPFLAITRITSIIIFDLCERDALVHAHTYKRLAMFCCDCIPKTYRWLQIIIGIAYFKSLLCNVAYLYEFPYYC